MVDPLIRKIDCYMVSAPDLDAAVEFYEGRLGQRLIWRSQEAAAFELPDDDAELVVHKRLPGETDLVVDNVGDALARLMSAGATCVAPMFDIAIGKCAVVKDPFGNVLTILDQSKGRLDVDADKNVRGLVRRTWE